MTHSTFRLMAAAVLVLMAWNGVSTSAQGQATAELAPQIEWPTFETAFTNAADNEKIVIIDVWSDNCGWCRKLQSEVYTQPDLQQFIYDNFELGRLDIDAQTDSIAFRGYTLSSQMLAGSLGATGTPTTIFLEPSGTYITRLQGFHTYEDFFDVLKFIGSESYREMSFEDFLQAVK